VKQFSIEISVLLCVT